MNNIGKLISAIFFFSVHVCCHKATETRCLTITPCGRYGYCNSDNSGVHFCLFFVLAAENDATVQPSVQESPLGNDAELGYATIPEPPYENTTMATLQQDAMQNKPAVYENLSYN